MLSAHLPRGDNRKVIWNIFFRKFKNIYSGWGLGNWQRACLRSRIRSPAPRERSHLSKCHKAFLLVFHSLARDWESEWRGKWEWAGSLKGLSPHFPCELHTEPRVWDEKVKACMNGRWRVRNRWGRGGRGCKCSSPSRCVGCKPVGSWMFLLKSPEAKMLNTCEVKAIASSWAEPLFTCIWNRSSLRPSQVTFTL